MGQHVPSGEKPAQEFALTIRVTGFNSKDTTRIKKSVNAALDQIGVDIDIEVEPMLTAEQYGNEARAGDGKLGLGFHLLDKDLTPDVRLGWIVQEETAHLVLEACGVPHDGLAAFFQELFATYHQARAFIVTGRIPKERLTYTEPTPVATLYDLGKHLGATTAGNRKNGQILERWKNDPQADPRQVSLVETVEQRLRTPPEPEDIADLFAEIRDDFRDLDR